MVAKENRREANVLSKDIFCTIFNRCKLVAWDASLSIQDTKFLSHFIIVDNVSNDGEKKRDRVLEKYLYIIFCIYALLKF